MAIAANAIIAIFVWFVHRKLVIATAHMQPSPMSFTIFGRSASELDRTEYVSIWSGRIQVLVGLSLERAVER